MMLHAVINLSWKCQLKCPYCWLPHTNIDLKCIEHSPDEWIEAIIRTVPVGGAIDFSGGEPLLYNGLDKVLDAIGKAGIQWAITTNALSTEGVNALLETDPPGCLLINISDHTGNRTASDNINKLKAAYFTSVNRVLHEGAGNREDVNTLLTYQAWEEGDAVDGIDRKCTAGCNHWTADPSGNVYRCGVDMQIGNEPFGNLFDANFKAMTEPKDCHFGCSVCYTDLPEVWLIQMREL